MVLTKDEYSNKISFGFYPVRCLKNWSVLLNLVIWRLFFCGLSDSYYTTAVTTSQLRTKGRLHSLPLPHSPLPTIKKKEVSIIVRISQNVLDRCSCEYIMDILFEFGWKLDKYFRKQLFISSRHWKETEFRSSINYNVVGS